MIPIPLEELVRALQVDPLAYGSYWVVTCEECDKDFRIWPDRGGLLCDECGTPLVALVAMSELMRT
jgi:rRNA maturation endonuclease Nob1